VWRLFHLCRNEGQIAELTVHSRRLSANQPEVKPIAPKVVTIGDAITTFVSRFRLKVLSGGRKARTYDAIEDILLAFRDKVGAARATGWTAAC